MKKIYSKFNKQLIPSLPQVLFSGKIETILSEEDAEKAVDYLLSQDIIGFDTETKPIFKAGRQNDVALLQVSSNDVCFLFCDYYPTAAISRSDYHGMTTLGH